MALPCALGRRNLAGGGCAALCRDAEKRASRSSANSSISINQPDGTPYDDPAELSLALSCSGRRGRDRHHHAADALCLWRLWRARPRLPGSAASSMTPSAISASSSALHPLCRDNPLQQARHIAAFAPRRHHGTADRGDCRVGSTRYFSARSTSTSPSRPRKSTTASPGRASGRSNICSSKFDLSPRWCAIHATHMTEAETQRSRPIRRDCRPVPDHRSQSGRRHFPGRSLPRCKGRNCHRLRQPHHRESRRKTCASSNIPSACAIAPAMYLADGPGRSTGRRLYDAVACRGRQGHGAARRRHRAGPSRRYLPCSMPTIPL